ncbi:uncharacterized protein TrAtP1_010943 [Trichoderma atroviride]|uniref:uncharacterized protein n=1 Tax=Hypocrea atroviridis TaxID=63577 RepID=UPI00332DFD53|nr:hypothetical protein TrAtP1_010943 [Trichoderma atroviride]
MTAQGVASWTEIADGTPCGRDPDEIGVPARWALDGTEDERQGFSQSREKGGEGYCKKATAQEHAVGLAFCSALQRNACCSKARSPFGCTFRIGFPGGSAGEGASGRSAVLDAATIPIEGEATQAEATLI